MPGPSGLQGQDTLPQISAARCPAATPHGQAAVAPKHCSHCSARHGSRCVREAQEGRALQAGVGGPWQRWVLKEGALVNPLSWEPAVQAAGGPWPMAREMVPWLEIPRTLSAEEEPKAPASGYEGPELMAAARDPAPGARPRGGPAQQAQSAPWPLAFPGGRALVKRQIALPHPNPEPESLSR